MNKRIEPSEYGEGSKKSGGSFAGLLWNDRSKWAKFGIIMVLLVIVSAISSLIARTALFNQSYSSDYKIAVIAPLTGKLAPIGKSIQQGAEIYTQTINENGGLDGRYLGVEVLDNKGDTAVSAQMAQQALSNEDVIGIVGPWLPENVAKVAQLADKAGKAVMTMSPKAYAITKDYSSLYNLSYASELETKFLANYMRNVLQEKLVSIIFDRSSYGPEAQDFTETFERFGIPLRHSWELDAKDANLDQTVHRIAEEVKAANDSGAIYLAMDENVAAKVIKALRDKKAINNLMGSHLLATNAFEAAFGNTPFAPFADSMVTAGPLMYDTANQKIQNFRSAYIGKYQKSPDWVAAYGYEGANVLGQSLLNMIKDEKLDSSQGIGQKISALLASRIPVSGVTGDVKFDTDGVSNNPIQVGVYDGRQIISAPTQLQPIAQGEIDNYIQAVRDGRALYVNDRFMYKTNVVYSGILIDKVSDYDPAKETVNLEFSVWFRYRGDFDPQNVIFENAVEPIKLDTPDRVETIGKLKYKRYRVNARFETNFADVQRNYGSKLVGTSFRHQVLNQNNLYYVVDVVGVGLTNGGTYQDQLRESGAMGVTLGLIPERSWISQEIVHASGLGNPTFVGYGKPNPDFSQLGVGIIAVDGAVSLRDLLPNSYLVYIAIFGAMGSIFAIFMDRKREGQHVFWNLQSWLLRIVCWPLLLASTGGLVLNFAFQNFEFHYVEMIAPIYEGIWWIIGAALVAMAVDRFIWTPLENRTQRKVPSSIRAFIKVAIYLFAFFGIIAFVMHKELTSLLATSGLLAMIIGLAVQANIANIFSGIVLNLERPFNVGDIISLDGGVEATVVDISWRTTRAIDGLGKLHCIPNSKATETNLIRVTGSKGEIYPNADRVYVDPDHSPAIVKEALERAINSVETIDFVVDPPRVDLREMVLANGRAFAQYVLVYNAVEYGKRWQAKNALWSAVHRELEAVGVSISTAAPKGSVSRDGPELPLTTGAV